MARVDGCRSGTGFKRSLSIKRKDALTGAWATGAIDGSRMRRLLPILPCALWLTACASSGTPVATCTNIISTGGGLLQFCQTADKLRVSESGVDTGQGADVKIVDDSATLKRLESDIHPRADLAASRNLVSRACLVKGQSYVTVAADDLKRIIAEGVPAASQVASAKPL